MSATDDLVNFDVAGRSVRFEGSPTLESNAVVELRPGTVLPMIVMVRVAASELAAGNDGDLWREDVLEVTRAVVLDDQGREYLIDLIRAAGVPTLFDQPRPDGDRPTDVEPWPGFAAMGGGAITLPAHVMAGNAVTVATPAEVASIVPASEPAADDDELGDVDEEWPDTTPVGRHRRDDFGDDQPAPEPGLDDAVTVRQIRPGDKHLSKFLREPTEKGR